MGEAGKRKEMVKDRCVQEMRVEVRCVKKFRVKVLLVKEVCVKACKSGVWKVVSENVVGERVVWDRSGCKSAVCPRHAWESACASKNCVWDRSVRKGVV